MKRCSYRPILEVQQISVQNARWQIDPSGRSSEEGRCRETSWRLQWLSRREVPVSRVVAERWRDETHSRDGKEQTEWEH